MKFLIGGLAAVIIGLIGIILCWSQFLNLLTGGITLLLLLGGALAIYLGFQVTGGPDMEKGKLNLIIDALMFILLMAIAGLGFLMKYVLIPGKETFAVYGRHVELYLWGMDRHDWGAIHLYLAFTLLGVLVIHIILHWQMIVGLFGRLIASPKVRTRIAFAILLLTVILLYFPFLITPEVQERGPGQGRGRGRVELRLESPGANPSFLVQTDYQVGIRIEDMSFVCRSSQRLSGGEPEIRHPSIADHCYVYVTK